MERRNIALLLAWMAGALVSFSATAIGLRAAARDLPLFEILATRTAFGLMIVSAFLLARGKFLEGVRTRRLRLHVARNLLHYAATYGWALGLTLLPLVTVFAIEFTMPFWVAILAVPLLGERITATRIVSIALGFLGVLVILRPGADTFQPASVLMLAVALGFALVNIGTKKLTTTESTLTIVFWMNAIQLPINLAGSRWGFWSMIEVETVLPLLAVCVGGLTSHLCLTNAYRYADASVVVPLDFLRIPLISLVGWQLYGENPDPFVIGGALIIVVGILINLRAEARRA